MMQPGGRGEQIRQEWRQNRRLRIGVLVVVAVIGMHLVLTLSDRQQRLADEYHQRADLLVRLQDASRESAWPERAEQAEQALAAVREGIPRVSSAGLAQAELQAWLSGQAESARLQDIRVRAETTLDVPDHPQLWQVIARLDASVPAGRLEGFLRQLSAGLPWIQAERLELAEARNDATRLGLIVRGYYRKPDPAAAGAGTDAATAGGTPPAPGAQEPSP